MAVRAGGLNRWVKISASCRMMACRITLSGRNLRLVCWQHFHVGFDFRVLFPALWVPLIGGVQRAESVTFLDKQKGNNP